jgi:hypothetical protein
MIILRIGGWRIALRSQIPLGTYILLILFSFVNQYTPRSEVQPLSNTYLLCRSSFLLSNLTYLILQEQE